MTRRVMHRRARAPSHGRFGFGLLELVIAMAVIAVLVGLAMPIYQQYVIRAHRAEAVRILLGAAACQERLRAANGHYDTSRCASGLDTGHYAFLIEPPGETEALEFRVVAMPRRAAAADGCGSLSLDHAGSRAITGSRAISDCWGGR
jgi:type IV pilus assembly protein PilE